MSFFLNFITVLNWGRQSKGTNCLIFLISFSSGFVFLFFLLSILLLLLCSQYLYLNQPVEKTRIWLRYCQISHSTIQVRVRWYECCCNWNSKCCSNYFNFKHFQISVSIRKSLVCTTFSMCIETLCFPQRLYILYINWSFEVSCLDGVLSIVFFCADSRHLEKLKTSNLNRLTQESRTLYRYTYL